MTGRWPLNPLEDPGLGSHEESPSARAQRKARRGRSPLSALEDPAPRPPKDDPATAWKWAIGGVTYFNRPPINAHLPVVEDIPLAARNIAPAFLSGYSQPGLPADSYSGAVYLPDGKIVPEFLEYDRLTQHRMLKRVNPPVVDAARVDDAEKISETCVYLGPLARHFGHFLLESLQRAWYLKDAPPESMILFHTAPGVPELQPFARVIFEALRVDSSRIRFATRDVEVARLILPSSQFWQGIKASPGVCVVFDHIREGMLKHRRRARGTPAKIYLTRRGLSGERASGRPRAAVWNEQEAELLFQKRGYEIVRPETLPLQEQVEIVANATHVAGTSGSALHLILFNDNPRAKLIELRTKPAFNQLLISAIRGSEAFHIWSAAAGSSPEKTILDMAVIERAMREID